MRSLFSGWRASAWASPGRTPEDYSATFQRSVSTSQTKPRAAREETRISCVVVWPSDFIVSVYRPSGRPQRESGVEPRRAPSAHTSAPSGLELKSMATRLGPETQDRAGADCVETGRISGSDAGVVCTRVGELGRFEELGLAVCVVALVLEVAIGGTGG